MLLKQVQIQEKKKSNNWWQDSKELSKWLSHTELRLTIETLTD